MALSPQSTTLAFALWSHGGKICEPYVDLAVFGKACRYERTPKGHVFQWFCAQNTKIYSRFNREHNDCEDGLYDHFQRKRIFSFTLTAFASQLQFLEFKMITSSTGWANSYLLIQCLEMSAELEVPTLEPPAILLICALQCNGNQKFRVWKKLFLANVSLLVVVR